MRTKKEIKEEMAHLRKRIRKLEGTPREKRVQGDLRYALTWKWALEWVLKGD